MQYSYIHTHIHTTHIHTLFFLDSDPLILNYWTEIWIQFKYTAMLMLSIELNELIAVIYSIVWIELNWVDEKAVTSHASIFNNVFIYFESGYIQAWIARAIIRMYIDMIASINQTALFRHELNCRSSLCVLYSVIRMSLRGIYTQKLSFPPSSHKWRIVEEQDVCSKNGPS